MGNTYPDAVTCHVEKMFKAYFNVLYSLHEMRHFIVNTIRILLQVGAIKFLIKGIFKRYNLN